MNCFLKRRSLLPGTPAGTSLVAGCTNGLVLRLFWHGELGSEVTQPRITTIWPCADGIGVYHIAWEDKV